MSEAFKVQPGPMYSGGRPARDPLYLRFIKSLPCLACSRTWWVDPCHTGPHGIGQKSDDYSSIPLCRKHHHEFDSAPAAFIERHGIDLPAVIGMFQTFYHTKKKAA